MCVPDPLEQVLGAADAPVGDQQFLQHAHFLAVERDRAAGPADPPPGPVEHDAAAGDHRGGGRAAPGQRADPCDEFGERERLGQVVVGAEVEAVHPVVHRARRGQHQDAGLRRRTDQRGADRVAVDAGQVTVQDDDIVGVQQRLLDGGRAVVGHVRADALVAQAVGDVVGQFGLILDHEHPHGAIVPQAGSHGHHKLGRTGGARAAGDLA